MLLTQPHKNARVAQLVERDLAKVEAAGSSPVSRSLGKAQKYREIGTPEFSFVQKLRPQCVHTFKQ